MRKIILLISIILFSTNALADKMTKSGFLSDKLWVLFSPKYSPASWEMTNAVLSSSALIMPVKQQLI